MTATLNPTYLSPTQVSILEAGTTHATFKLTPKQAGRSSGQLVDREWIRPTAKKGYWEITDLGRNAYQTHLAEEAARNDQVYKQTESAINLDDPALKPGSFETLNFSAAVGDAASLAALANQRQVKINQLEKTLDDMGTLVDELSTKIKTLEAAQTVTSVTTRISDEPDPLESASQMTKDIMATLLQMKAADACNLSLVGYVEDLRKKATSVDQAAAQVEALRRQLDHMSTELEAANRHTNMNEINAFLASILDELAQVMPEVDEYRESRERSHQVMKRLQAKRS
jgi:phage shock protein A